MYGVKNKKSVFSKSDLSMKRMFVFFFSYKLIINIDKLYIAMQIS